MLLLVYPSTCTCIQALSSDILFTDCSSIHQHLTEINRAFSRLCPTNATVPTYSATWNSVSRTRIGGINFATTNTQSFPIPSVVPDTATEVLLFIEIIAGYNPNNDYCIVKIFTEESDDRRFEKYISIRTYPQSGHTMTEDNMWFPFMANRRVYLKLSKTMNLQNMGSNIHVIGYR